MQGPLRKMKTTFEGSEPVQYALPLGENEIALNPWIGRQLRLTFQNEIFCVACGRKTRRSFQQGYCYPCSQRLARCDICIVKPERCHYDQGTCREPEWGETHCMIPHVVYVANSSGLKVGITRAHQRLTRWIDQGAIQAKPLLKVKRRLDAGRVEVALKRHVADKTNWRRMLKGEAEPLDLDERGRSLLEQLPDDGVEVEPLEETTTSIIYPVERAPEKIKSWSFEKHPVVEGTLQGIKGQYLIFDTGVLNVRKHAGFTVSLENPG